MDSLSFASAGPRRQYAETVDRTIRISQYKGGRGEVYDKHSSAYRIATEAGPASPAHVCVFVFAEGTNPSETNRRTHAICLRRLERERRFSHVNPNGQIAAMWMWPFDLMRLRRDERRVLLWRELLPAQSPAGDYGSC
jgi:hypothetical protein